MKPLAECANGKDFCIIGQPVSGKTTTMHRLATASAKLCIVWQLCQPTWRWKQKRQWFHYSCVHWSSRECFRRKRWCHSRLWQLWQLVLLLSQPKSWMQRFGGEKRQNRKESKGGNGSQGRKDQSKRKRKRRKGRSECYNVKHSITL